LRSEGLFDLERAVAAAALVGGLAIFVVRGFGGCYPTKISMIGADYPGLAATAAGTADLTKAVEAMCIVRR